MIVRALATLGARHNLPTAIVQEGSLAFTALTVVIAGTGLMAQLRNGFGVPLPFPLSLLLLPLDFLEWIVKAAVYLTS